MSGVSKDSKQVGYMMFPGLGHVVYLSREDVTALKMYPPNVLEVLITKAVCEIMDLPIEKLSSFSRKQPLPLARQVCMYSMVMDFGLSLKRVGKLLRPEQPYNHSTVHHGREMIKDYLDPADETRFAKGVKEIYSKLNLKLKSYIDESNRTYRQGRKR
jgi:hypothetical protein